MKLHHAYMQVGGHFHQFSNPSYHVTDQWLRSMLSMHEKYGYLKQHGYAWIVYIPYGNGSKRIDTSEHEVPKEIRALHLLNE